MKAGTTALSNFLNQHPGIYVVPGKEVYFFERDEVWARGVDWYRSLFAGASPGQLACDGSPSTMFYAHAIERAAAVVPDAKVVVILRHPAERAWSQYWHQVLHTPPQPSFEDLVASELADPHEPFIIERSRYLPQIERLCRHFPRERVLVLLLDDLEERPHDVWAELCDFLGVDAEFVPPNLGTVVNAAVVHRSVHLLKALHKLKAFRRLPAGLSKRLFRSLFKPAPSRDLVGERRQALVDEFASGVEDLGRWLGRDLTSWNR
jgi:hypothetical protein